MTATSSVSLSVDEETRLILEHLESLPEQEVEPLVDDPGETYHNHRPRNTPEGHLADSAVEAVETVRRRSADAGFYRLNRPSAPGSFERATLSRDDGTL